MLGDRCVEEGPHPSSVPGAGSELQQRAPSGSMWSAQRASFGDRESSCRRAGQAGDSVTGKKEPMLFITYCEAGSVPGLRVDKAFSPPNNSYFSSLTCDDTERKLFARRCMESYLHNDVKRTQSGVFKKPELHPS